MAGPAHCWCCVVITAILRCVGSFEQIYVSYNQFQVDAGGDIGGLRLFATGDDLVSLGGESTLTVLTGPHTAPVAVRVITMPWPPDDDLHGWDAVSEATIWCPDSHIWVHGLMNDGPDTFREITVPGPGLVRVQVRARNRQPDGPDWRPEPPEQYEIRTWPVTEDVGIHTLRSDDRSPFAPARRPVEAAGWALARLVDKANPQGGAWVRAMAPRSAPPPPQPPRVAVLRGRTLPAAQALAVVRQPAEHFGAVPDAGDLVLRGGAVEVRLSPVTPVARPPDSLHVHWRWTTAPGSTTRVPDAVVSSVEVHARHRTNADTGTDAGTAELIVRHHGVRAEDAIPLGLLWDYLIPQASSLTDDAAAAAPPLWQGLLDETATGTARGTFAGRRPQQPQKAEPAEPAVRAVRAYGRIPPSPPRS